MQTQSLAAELRTSRGKGAARQLRMRDRIPGVFYGPEREPTALSVAPKELVRVLSTDHGRNALIQIDLDGKQQLAMIKELQIHPVTRAPIHVDFYQVDVARPVVASVPFVAKGRAKGVVAGGELHVVFREVPVRSTPDRIPASITIDVTNMELHATLPVKDLSLPEGVTVLLSPNQNLIAVVTPRRRQELDAAAGEGAPGDKEAGGPSSPGTQDAARAAGKAAKKD